MATIISEQQSSNAEPTINQPEMRSPIDRLMATFNKILQILMKTASLANKKTSSKVLALIVAVFIVLMVIWVAHLQHAHNQNPTKPTEKSTPSQLSSERNAATLTDIQTKLAMLEQRLAQQNTAQDLAPVTSQLNDLHHMLLTTRQENVEQIQQQLTRSNTQLEQEISRLQANFTTLMQSLQQTKTTYLHADALPFSVVAIDMIQQQAVVTLQYDYKSFPVQTGDTVAGWQLAQVDSAAQTAEFINTKQQHVIVHLHVT